MDTNWPGHDNTSVDWIRTAWLDVAVHVTIWALCHFAVRSNAHIVIDWFNTSIFSVQLILYIVSEVLSPCEQYCNLFLLLCAQRHDICIIGTCLPLCCNMLMYFQLFSFIIHLLVFLQAIMALDSYPTPKSRQALTATIENDRCFYRIRIDAAHHLAKVCEVHVSQKSHATQFYSIFRNKCTL